MKTVYIDVYFLINFCVDTLALGIAAYFLKIKCGILRLSSAGAVGALYAVLGILLSDYKYLTPIISIPLFLLMIIIVTKKISLTRKIKYALMFFLSEMIIGGMVYYGFLLLNRIMKHFEFEESNIENRNLLILSIIVLLSYGVVKFAMLIFGNLHNLREIKVCVGFGGHEHSFEALVDSGNLARDPQDSRPVIFITHKLAERILGEPFSSDGELKIGEKMKSRLRLIPIKSGGENRILYGFLGDYVTLVRKNKYESVDVTFAIDTKGDSFGGYDALVPSAALDNVF